VCSNCFRTSAQELKTIGTTGYSKNNVRGIPPSVSNVSCKNAYTDCPPAVERYPEGYPRISAYIDSDSDAALFRRFGVLHARSLLYKQVELTELEAQLDKLDKDDEGNPGADSDKWRLGHSISLNGGQMNEKRRDLMKKIDEKLEEYGIFYSFNSEEIVSN
jgi:hypothetical protein